MVKLSADKYHEIWFIQIVEELAFGPSPYQFLFFLKNSPVEQVDQLGRSPDTGQPITRFEWSSNCVGLEWESFVANAHTLPYLDKPVRKILAIREVLQSISILLFPNWIMDRFKEALGQYVRGEWLSAISLCGDIVEFIVNELWAAYYPNPIPKSQPKPPKGRVMRALDKLLEFGVLNEEDYNNLKRVRKARDNHVHNYPRILFLEGDYSTKLKEDSLKSLSGLSEFFTRKNIESKYKRYLDYAEKFIIT